MVGEGIDGARLRITDWSGGGNDDAGAFDFGTWGVPTSHTFTVWNSGNKPASVLTGLSLSAPFSWTGDTFPGAGGTCNGMLAVGASCTVVVGFSGAATGGAKVRISYVDGAGHTVEATRDVIGTHAANAVLFVSDCDGCGVDSRPADFGTVGTSSTRWFTVRNNGGQAAQMVRDAGLLGGGFAYAGGVYPGTNGSCSSTLTPGSSCQVTVTFTPPGPGTFAGTLGITYDDGTGTTATATRALTGAKTSLALLKVHDWSEADNGGGDVYDLGTAGVPVDHTFTLTNDGAQPATLMADGGGFGSGFNYKGGSYPGIDGTCTGSLAAGAHCTVVVRFTPSGSGYRSSQLLIFYYDGANTQYAKRVLSATATNRALLQISDWSNSPSPNGPNPPPYDYGVVGSAQEHTFTVTNWGAVAATLIADGGTLGGGFGWTNNAAFGGGTCGAMLASGATCTVSVTFTPTGDGGRTSTLSLAYNDGATTQVAARALTGTATTKAMLNIYDWNGPNGPEGNGGNGAPLDYGVWGVAADHEFTVRNDGGGPATMMASAGTLGTGFNWKDGTYPGTGGDCGAMLAVGATCKLVVTFTPSGLATLFGQVRVAYNDGATTRTAIRGVMGTPTARAHLTVAEFFGPNNCSDCGPFDYGSVAAANTLEHTFTVYNTGALPATSLMPTSGLNAPFAYKAPGGYPGNGGTCGSMLAAGTSCQLIVVFAPQGAGSANSTINLGYDDTFASPLTASRAITGTGF
jgi:hypothetical protein